MDEIQNLELKIAKFLRVGIIVAGLMMLVGWGMGLKFKIDPFFNFQIYDPIPFQDLYNYHLKRGDWWILLSYAGLATLISLPVIRVLLTGILFIKQGEKTLAFVATLVLLALFVSFALGIEI